MNLINLHDYETVNGAPGVHHVLEILRRELELAMALSGHPTLASIDRSLVQVM